MKVSFRVGRTPYDPRVVFKGGLKGDLYAGKGAEGG